MFLERFILVLIGYLLGSIPFGYLYSRWIRGVNIRDRGSGNIGATNIIRNFGWIPGTIVLLLDALKGAIPAGLSYYSQFPGEQTLALCVGGIAILGHIYPVYLGFEGGKGVATSAGVFLTLAPIETIGALLVFLLAVSLTRFMSVGSLLGAVTLPTIGFIRSGLESPLAWAATLLAIMIFWQHRENIRRLIRGEENRFF